MTEPAAVHVLVVQHAAGEGSGAIGASLRARGIDQRVVRTDLGHPVPPDLGGARALVVMGGPMGVYEADRYPHLRDEMRLIDRAIAAGVPVLGVCLGSQLVAAALGARVERASRREVGWREVRLREVARQDALWARSPDAFVPLHWHGDVFDLPAGAVSLASSEQTVHQAFRFGASTWGVLFHVEMDAAQVEAMAAEFHDDLAQAGLSRGDVLDDVGARVAHTGAIAASAYGAWASLVT
jgi:GMP synthase (glutamine-hydrolysing)